MTGGRRRITQEERGSKGQKHTQKSKSQTRLPAVRSAHDRETEREKEGIIVAAKEKEVSAPEQAEAKGKSGAVVGSPEWYEELVSIRLFKDSEKYKEDVYVGVNGKGWLIQRGVEVQVPRYVAQVLEQSVQQDEQAAALMEEKAGEFDSESRRLGI